MQVDYIDESEVLTPADEAFHVDKWKFTVPFVCGATNLGEAIRRISEGAAMIRSKGEAGTGNVVEAVQAPALDPVADRAPVHPSEEGSPRAKDLGAASRWSPRWRASAALPVPLFTAGGIAIPADAALMMQLGAEAVFVGSGIFKSGDPAKRAEAIVKATTYHDDPERSLRPPAVSARPWSASTWTPSRPSSTTQAGAGNGSCQLPRSGSSPLQGNFASHASRLRGLGAGVREVRTPASWTAIAGLVIPGGESTAMSRLAEAYGFSGPLQAADRIRVPRVRLLRRDDHAGRPVTDAWRASRPTAAST